MPKRTVSLKTVNALAAALPVIFGISTAVSSLAFKSERTRANAAWSDGGEWWVALGFFGGLLIALAMVWGAKSDRLLAASLFATPVFWWIGHEVSAYRTHLETTFQVQSYYSEQHLAFGLRVVPTLAFLGSVTSALLALAVILTYRPNRRYPPRPANAVH